MKQKIPVSCAKDCGGGGCPLLAHLEDGKVTHLSTNPVGGRYLKGCIRGFQAQRTLYAPERITRPLIRTGRRGSGQFREAGWDEALDLTAQRLTEVRERYGAQSILHLDGSGSVGGLLHNASGLALRFLNLFGGCTSVKGNYSCGAALFALKYVLGEDAQAGFDPATLQYSRLIMLWGGNHIETRQGSEMPARLRQAAQNGVPLVVIDPRRTPSVDELGAQWIPCRPGSDAALMLALLYVIFQEGLADEAYAARLSVGFEELKRYVLGEGTEGKAHTPEWAETICGTPAAQIRSLARRYALAKPAALVNGYSIQRSPQGELAFWLSVALQLATANLGVKGGTSGARNSDLPIPRVGRLDTFSPPDLPRVPVLRWPDAVLEGRSGGYPSDIHAIYNAASNYLVQGSDIHKNMRAFDCLDFSVCHDYFLTPTANWCDVVLPVTNFLERSEIVVPWVGNYLLFSQQAVTPQGQARNDYAIFCDLAGRLGFESAFSKNRSEEDWLNALLAQSEIPDIEEFRSTGIYWGANQERVGLSNFSADPKAHPLQTPSGRIELSSAAYARETGFPPIPQFEEKAPPQDYPLLLVTPKSRYRIHSQGSNISWLREREAHALWMNPQDAHSRGLSNGERVAVSSPQGCLRVPVEVTDAVMPGVVCLRAGIWPEFGPDGVDEAGSANVLTSTTGSLPSQGSATHGVAVQVSRK